MLPTRHTLSWYKINSNSDVFDFINIRKIIRHSDSSWTLHNLAALPQLQFEGHLLICLGGSIATGCIIHTFFRKYLKNFRALEQVLPTLKYNPFLLQWGNIHNVVATYLLNRLLFGQYFTFFSRAVHGQISLLGAPSSSSSSSIFKQGLSLVSNICTFPLRVAARCIYNSLNNTDLVSGSVAWEFTSFFSTLKAATVGIPGSLSNEDWSRVSAVLRDLPFTTDYLSKYALGAPSFQSLSSLMVLDGLHYDDIRLDPRSRLLGLASLCTNSLFQLLSPISPAPGFFLLNVALDSEAGQTPLSIQQGMRLGCRDALALGLAIFATHATFKIIRGNWRWIWGGFKHRSVDMDMNAMGILGARHTTTTGPSINKTLSPARQQIEATLSNDETLYPTYFQWRYELLDFVCKSAFLIFLHGLGSTFLGIKYLSVSQEALLSIVPRHSSLSTSSLVSAIPSVAVWATSRAIQFPFSTTVPGLLGHNLISLCAICWSCYPQFIVETAAASLVGGDLDELDVSACEQVFQVVTGIPPQRLSIRQLQQFSEFSATIGLGANGQDPTPNSTRAGACLLLNILQVLIATRKASPSLQPVRFLDEIEECSFENPENDEELECTICLAGFDGNDVPFKLKKCGHTFHVQCLGQWLAAQHQCPLCRHDIKVMPLPSSSESSDGSGEEEEAEHLPTLYDRRLIRGFSPHSFRPRLTRQPVVHAWIDDGIEGAGGMAIHNVIVQGVLLAGLTDLGWVFTRGNTCSPSFDCMEDAVDYMREVLLAEIIASTLHNLLGPSFAPSQFLDLSPEFHQQEQQQLDGPATVLGRTRGPSDRVRTQAQRRQYLLRYGKFWVSCMIRMRSLHHAQVAGITTSWHRLVYYAFAMSLSVFTPLI